MAAQALIMWTVYQDPTDYPPGTYLARKWIIGQGEPVPCAETITGTTLEEVRAAVKAEGAVNVIGRDPGDKPAILEVWC